MVFSTGSSLRRMKRNAMSLDQSGRKLVSILCVLVSVCVCVCTYACMCTYMHSLEGSISCILIPPLQRSTVLVIVHILGCSLLTVLNRRFLLEMFPCRYPIKCWLLLPLCPSEGDPLYPTLSLIWAATHRRRYILLALTGGRISN